MPASGYKLFATGDVLTAADVNNYLMLQTVMVFANSAARTTALSGVLAEGLVSYLKDTDVVEIYTGAAWVSLDDPNAVQNASYYAAGKNAIINGAMNVWQRGTSFTNPNGAYCADRFKITATAATVSQQAFTAGTAPVAGYESQYFLRIANAVGATTFTFMQPIEDVRTFAGQTVTFSFWAKAGAAISMNMLFRQNFGSGGSADVDSSNNTIALTTSWARYTQTVTLGAMTGKTIGTSSSLQMYAYYASGTVASSTIDTWGWQVEAGATATAFQTASGTIGGELALCQRYYYRQAASGAYSTFAYGYARSAIQTWGMLYPPVTMRTTPTTLDFSTLGFQNYVGTEYAMTLAAIDATSSSPTGIAIYATISGATAGHTGFISANNSTSAYIGLGAEL